MPLPCCRRRALHCAHARRTCQRLYISSRRRRSLASWPRPLNCGREAGSRHPHVAMARGPQAQYAQLRWRSTARASRRPAGTLAACCACVACAAGKAQMHLAAEGAGEVGEDIRQAPGALQARHRRYFVAWRSGVWPGRQASWRGGDDFERDRSRCPGRDKARAQPFLGASTLMRPCQPGPSLPTLSMSSVSLGRLRFSLRIAAAVCPAGACPAPYAARLQNGVEGQVCATEGTSYQSSKARACKTAKQTPSQPSALCGSSHASSLNRLLAERARRRGCRRRARSGSWAGAAACGPA